MLPPAANGPASWQAGGLTPEEIEADLAKQATQEDQQAYLEALDPALVDAWAGWKEGKGDVVLTEAAAAPEPIPGTNTRVGTPRRMPYIAANQSIADGVPEEVDPQQLAQMLSMKAAAESANGRQAQEPQKVEGAGPLGGDLGMYLRAAANGATALPAIPINLMTSMMPFGGDGDVVGSIMDLTGAKRPQSRDERITSDIIAGLTGSGAVMAGGKALTKLGMKEAGEKLAGSPIAQLIGGGTGGAASGVVREEGGGQTEQIIAALLAGGIPTATSMGTKEAFTRGVPQERLAETMDNFTAAGTTPTIGQLTGGDKAQGTEAFLAQFYGSSPVIKNKLTEQEEAVIGANKAVSDSMAPLDLATGKPVQMSPAEMGNLIEDTWTNSGKKAISATREQFGKNLAAEVNPRAGVEMPNLTAITDELTRIDPGAKNLSQNKIFNPNLTEFTQLGKDLKKDLEINYKRQIDSGTDPIAAKKSLPFEAVRKLKTQLGSQMDNSVFGAQNISQADQRRLFGGIAEDIKAFVKDQGVDAEKAFNDWNKWEVAYHKEVSALRSVLDKNGGPEKVFKAAFAGANEGPTVLNAVYSNLDEGARRTLTSAWLAKASKSSSKVDPDEDNLGQLFGNYDRLSPEAKDIMFAPEVRTQLDKLNSAARTILKSEKDFGMKAGGKSGNLGIQGPLYAGPALLASSASLSGGGEPGAALFAGLATMAGTAIGANALARYMTNPKTVKWMASNSKLPPSALPTAINLLSQEARKSQDPDMIEFARLMEEATQQEDE